MKKLMIFGGLLGFSIGLSFGWLEGCRGESVIWRASVAAFCAGLLLRWWGRVWVNSLKEAHAGRLAAAEQAETQSQTFSTKT